MTSDMIFDQIQLLKKTWEQGFINVNILSQAQKTTTVSPQLDAFRLDQYWMVNPK